jgi:hypothetical protein
MDDHSRPTKFFICSVYNSEIGKLRSGVEEKWIENAETESRHFMFRHAKPYASQQFIDIHQAQRVKRVY